MKFFLIVLSIMGCLYPSSNDSYLQWIRSNYMFAANDRELCSTMIEKLAKTEDNPIILAYLGGYKAIWAKHIKNPLSKLNTFKQGAQLIEKAVMIDSKNIEIRFVRLSVQKNCPFFLSYKKNIKEDTKFINTNKNNIRSEQLRSIVNYMIEMQ